MSDMSSAPGPGGQSAPPNLRFLKLLVTVLAGTMIVGLITIIALLVIRFRHVEVARPALPPAITLPANARAEAVTVGRGWIAVVTDAQEILIFDATTGALRQTVALVPAN